MTRDAHDRAGRRDRGSRRLRRARGGGAARRDIHVYEPPLPWRGTSAEALLDLATLRERTTFFEGSAREAALGYPKNADLAATVALAGLGLDRTRARLVADPAATGNTGVIEAASEIGDRTVVMAGRASANPKTSASAA